MSVSTDPRLRTTRPRTTAALPHRDRACDVLDPSSPLRRPLPAGLLDALPTGPLGVARLESVVETLLTTAGERPALAVRVDESERVAWISAAELWERAGWLAAAWAEDGLRPGECVATLGAAGVEHTLTLLACLRLGVTWVPLQTTATARQLARVVAQVRPRLLCVEVVLAAHGAALLGQLDAASTEAGTTVAAPRLVGMDDPSGELATDLARGSRLAPPPSAAPAADENPVAALIFTSGSTGSPKGARILEQRMAEMWTTPYASSVLADATGGPTLVHYLPFSHLYGLSWLISGLATGGVGLMAGGEAADLLDTVAFARPTSLNVVPRICDLILERHTARLGSGAAPERVDEVDAWMRSEVLGGRVSSAVTASAPLGEEMRAFMERVLAVALTDVYGSTEAGNVIVDGRLVEAVTDWRLVDVPELGYTGADTPHPRGELRVKSHTLIDGYHERSDATAAVFDEDGFYRTGDIFARLRDDRGDRFVYVDRASNVIKLSQGEFVALSALEADFLTSEWVEQVFLTGRSDRPHLLAVAVPAAGVPGHDDATLRERVLESWRAIAEARGLQTYEVPRDVLIERDPFTRANGLLSGVGKPLRPALDARYAEALERLGNGAARDREAAVAALREEASGLGGAEVLRRAAGIALSRPGVEWPDGVAFGDLGGDSLTAMTLTTIVQRVTGIELEVQAFLGPIATLATAASALDTARRAARSGGVSTRPSAASVHGPGARVARAADLHLADFVGASTLAAAAELPLADWPPRTVVLTGANGWLGRFLCLDWLERLADVDGGRLVCLVRARDDASARARVLAAFHSGDPELAAHVEALADRLEVRAADLAQPFLGLDPREWSELAEAADLVVHCGALVNHVLPYAQLFAPNVVGTGEVLRLAMTHRRTPVGFLSTVAVVEGGDGPPIDETVDLRSAMPERVLEGGYANGYATSKWASEVLLREAAEHGLPVAVLRSDMVLAHSRWSGQVNPSDLFTRLIFSVLRTGLAPRSFHALDASGARQRAHYDGLPADFTAEAVNTLASRPGPVFATYNVVNTHDDDVSLDTFVDWLIADGAAIERIDDHAEWVQRFEAALLELDEPARAASVLPLLHAYRVPHPVTAQTTPVPDAAFRAAVAEAGVGTGEVPHLDRDLVRRHVADLRRRGLIDPVS